MPIVPLILLAHGSWNCHVHALQLRGTEDYCFMQTHSITLGLNIGSEGQVTRQMWDDFVLKTVCTKLEYATIQDCQGIYQGTVESSKVISVNTDSPAIVETLLEVGQIYKNAFRQDAIMYTAVTLPNLVFK